LICAQIRETVDRDTLASRPSASARAASTSRVDNPRTYEAITNVSRALVRVTCAPKSRETNFSVVPRSLGRSKVTGPAVVLTVTGAYPLRIPGAASGVAALRWYRSRPRNAVISASNADCKINCAPSWAICSIAAARSRPPENTSSIRSRRRSLGDTFLDTGVGPLALILAVRSGPYARVVYTKIKTRPVVDLVQPIDMPGTDRTVRLALSIRFPWGDSMSSTDLSWVDPGLQEGDFSVT
jgi:hypothetical protein